MKLSICHLYPDLLYNDRGNILCMQKRLTWRGIEAEVTRLSVGEEARLPEFDLFFLGGGQSPACQGAEFRAAVEDGKVFLAIDAGYELLARIGALDVHVTDAEERFTGNLMFEARDFGPVVGFENHGGRVALGPKVTPLGLVLTGHGNNGADGKEGVVYKNTVGTYLHGPLLPKNPQLCDWFLSRALERKYPDFAGLAPLDDALERQANEFIAARSM